MIQPRIRRRRLTDLDGCVAGLATVHQADRYPLNWPADPHRWLREPHPARAWVAVDADAAILGHVAVHRVPSPANGPPARPTAEVARLFVIPRARGLALGNALLGRARQWASARGTDLVLDVTSGSAEAVALYERAGWRCTGSSTAPWTAPDGSPVSLRHYTLRSDAAPAIAARRRASRAAASRSSGGSSTSTS
ncbi:GNAT family N-acetyltransferase [Micromonospora sp. LH3U1]|uniref:GNAT family N-acetyltransferase n=1 Tax=Micromonospora sp. LH3U1 TaxID=3018339 RepID=UPI00234B838C|nr:GNAT family N-acetyltransferase [Micromonospora sp. LH3U1]WCN84193.1 GNAT family N-acetyltransferase [Micromonospora sp. LH3U1]